MADETTGQASQPESPASDDVSYLRKELDKAIAARDKAKAEARTLRDTAQLTAEERAKLDELTKAAAEAEERKAVEAGDFEALKQSILKEKAEAEAKAHAAEERYARKVVEAAFASATDLFGPAGITTLTPDFAYAGMSRFVDFVPGQKGAPDRIVVRGLDGDVISQGGEPVPFADGMRQLIEQWPGKEHILRTGQRAGSGSSGGTGTATLPGDRAALIDRARQGDQHAMQQLRESQPKGRVQRGPYFERLAREKAAAALAKK